MGFNVHDLDKFHQEMKAKRRAVQYAADKQDSEAYKRNLWTRKARIVASAGSNCAGRKYLGSVFEKGPTTISGEFESALKN